MDADADGKTDVLGIADNGDIWIAFSTGTSFNAPVQRGTTSISLNNGFFENNDWDRVWVANVEGDARPEIVGIDYNGNVYVSKWEWFPSAPIYRYGGPALVTTSAAFPRSTYFSTSVRPHVYVADVTADGRADVIGIHPTTGALTVVSNQGGSWSQSVGASTTRYTDTSGWLSLASQQRIWFADVTADNRADLVGVWNDGTVFVDIATASGFSVSSGPVLDPTTGAAVVSPFTTGATTATNYFSTATQRRVWMADADHDGRQDIVGIAPAELGDGDVWYMRAVMNGSQLTFEKRALLHQSIFQTNRGWLSASDQERVFGVDASGDSHMDLFGVDGSGQFWVAEGNREQGVGAGSSTSRFLLGPSVLTQASWILNSDFSTALRPRVFVGQFTGDGATDTIRIGSDGSIHWAAPIPTRVASVDAIPRSGLTSGTRTRLTVRFTRPVHSSVGASAYSCGSGGTTSGPIRVHLRGAGSGSTARAICDLAVASDGKSVSFDVDINSAQAIETVALSLQPNFRDRYGLTVDGDGDGQADPAAASLWNHRTVFSNTMVVGSAERSILAVGNYPGSSYDIPVSSGYTYCRTQSAVGSIRSQVSSDSNLTNPPKVRVIVLGGGGDGIDASTDRGLTVFASLDLVGYNSGRVARRLQSRFGIPASRFVAGATHAHATHRQIRPFEAPHFDDRHAQRASDGRYTSGEIHDPYVEWVDRQVIDAVGSALESLHTARLRVKTRLADTSWGFNRVSDGPNYVPLTDNLDRRITFVEFIDPTPGSTITWASIVNYAMHPVTEQALSFVNADFPGYLSKLRTQASNCPIGQTCASLFFNGGAGNTGPSAAFEGPAATHAERALNIATLINGRYSSAADAPDFEADLTGGFVSFGRSYGTFPGVANCQGDCGSTDGAYFSPTGGAVPNDTARHVSKEPRPLQTSVVWDIPTMAFSVRRSDGSPAIQVGVLPGEPSIEIQRSFTQLRSGQSETNRRSIFFGYSVEYDGYMPYFGQHQSNLAGAMRDYLDTTGMGGYGTNVCSSSALNGPVFFDLGEAPQYCAGARGARCSRRGASGGLPACASASEALTDASLVTCRALSVGSALEEAARALAGMSSQTAACP